MMDAETKCYIDLIRSYADVAKDLKNKKYNVWENYVGQMLQPQRIIPELMRKMELGEEDLAGYRRKDQTVDIIAMIADLTGFDKGFVDNLQKNPGSRELMFAFSYAIGIDYGKMAEQFVSGSRSVPKELRNYFKKAMLEVPDFRNIDDYICMSANVVYENMLENGIHISRRTTLKNIQNEIRSQINENMTDVYGFVSWNDFFEHYMQLNHHTVQSIERETGLAAKVAGINSWFQNCPAEYEYLYMICTMFHFNAIQITEVFDRFYKGSEKHPDFENQNDLVWLYIAEKYWDLSAMPFSSRSELVRHYIIDVLNKYKKYKPTMLDYYEIFKDMEFSLAASMQEDHDDPEKTFTVDSLDELGRHDRNPMKEYSFIVLKNRPLKDVPHRNVPTSLPFDAVADMLHATDPQRILWYWIGRNAKKPESPGEDMIERIYYGKEETERNANRMSGSAFLNLWTGSSKIHDYLYTTVYYGDLNNVPKSGKSKGNINSWDVRITNYTNAKGLFPDRRRLIVAGVILSMPVRAIDELLKAFGYEKLNNRDYTECLLIRILEDAEKLFPSAFLYESSRTDGAAEEFDQKKIIGNNIKSARREIRDGAKRVLITLYPDWFELIGNDRANPDAYALIADIPEDLDDEIIPSLIWPESLLRWSMRLHVRLCLLCAGMSQTDQSNWLLEGLENGYCVEDLELLTRVEQ